MKHQRETRGILTTTAIGGALFLLPLIVIGALIGQVVPILMSIAEILGEVLPVKTPGGIAMLILLALVVLILICFGAGLLARGTFAKRLSDAFEKKLLLFFPRYAIIKDQMADSIGGDQTKPKMKPVLVRFDDYQRIGFETERDDTAHGVVVFLPGSPDPWAGSVAIVSAERVTPLAREFGVAVAANEQLGRGFLALLSDNNSE